MPHLIAREQLRPSPTRTVELEGEPYGGETSLILVNMEPGAGPRLHLHPYSETWVVREGRALFTAGGEELEAETGDVVVVESKTPHGFKNLGPGRLQMVCIHAAARFETEWLET